MAQRKTPAATASASMQQPVDILLTRLDRRERARRVARAAIVSIAVASVASAALGVFIGAPALLLIPATTLVAGAVACALRVDRAVLARRVDALLDLRELLSTAANLHPSSDDPFERHVLRQAQDAARAVDVGAVSPAMPTPRAMLATGLLVVACASVVLLRSPAENVGASPAEAGAIARRTRFETSGASDRHGAWGASNMPSGRRAIDPDSGTPTALEAVTAPKSGNAAGADPPGTAAGDGSGAGQAQTPDPPGSDDRARRAALQPRDSVGDDASASGEGAATARAGYSAPADSSPEAVAAADPLHASSSSDLSWGASVDVARAALRDRRVPDRARDVVRHYFDLDAGGDAHAR